MPRVDAGGVRINYEIAGAGEPLLLIPALGADLHCFGLQLEDYARSFTCICVDLPGAGASDMPPGPYSTVGYADQMAAFLDAIGIESAHVSGLSLGSAVATHLAARHPDRVRSLTLSSTWNATDGPLRVRIENWCALARALPTVTEALILGVFPWCFTPDMYADRPGAVAEIEAFTRSLPPQPLAAFLAQAEAVLDHDASGALGAISAPTLITFGARDQVTSTRFLDAMRAGIPHAEAVVFEHMGHAGLNEDPQTFTAATLEFLLRQVA